MLLVSHQLNLVARFARQLVLLDRVQVAASGTVDEVMPDKGKVRVLVTIFGRQAPVELEYWQVSRVDG